MLGDGNGWVHGDGGAKYWGLHGAAGLFLRAGGTVLVQHRATWTAQGGTWGIPGGARDSHETPAEAALRETVEECGIDPSRVAVERELVTMEVPGWSYTTVIARTRDDAPLDVVPNEESDELRWVLFDDLVHLPLHPGFAASLETVLAAVGHTGTHD
ncbi:NUDIX hydrolase [Corynebacterium sp. TA-R-1]|uniref:NUDIX hydrolase n=1 Tax=Corynebacterium stercoris TaxID=2943490 RepID=A0ABT1G0V9_9CORY|nr:NUDIX hydrolase [Corynebacterium stercoris]MCP1387630.1 NUDIX hydrolase [Corynebacterium stercoris]